MPVIDSMRSKVSRHHRVYLDGVKSTKKLLHHHLAQTKASTTQHVLPFTAPTPPLMSDYIFLGRSWQSFQKINGVQHSHSRGKYCFHPLPGNWSKSGQPTPGNMFQSRSGLWSPVFSKPGARHPHPQHTKGLRRLLCVRRKTRGTTCEIASLFSDSQTR